jgi:hypothetical protein
MVIGEKHFFDPLKIEQSYVRDVSRTGLTQTGLSEGPLDFTEPVPGRQSSRAKSGRLRASS